jgi:hypothetical protein
MICLGMEELLLSRMIGLRIRNCYSRMIGLGR